MSASIERARAAFARRDWAAASAEFATCDLRTAEDHQQHAVAAYLTGADDICEQAWEAAHRAALEAGDLADAAHHAFWLALCLMMRGQMAQAGGWLTRAKSVVDDAGGGVAASGYLLIPELLGALDGGDAAAARELAERVVEIAKRFDDADLLAFGILGLGQALIALGDTRRGTARLDEAMVCVSAGEVGPITSGIVYCAVIFEAWHWVLITETVNLSPGVYDVSATLEDVAGTATATGEARGAAAVSVGATCPNWCWPLSANATGLVDSQDGPQTRPASDTTVYERIVVLQASTVTLTVVVHAWAGSGGQVSDPSIAAIAVHGPGSAAVEASGTVSALSVAPVL